MVGVTIDLLGPPFRDGGYRATFAFDQKFTALNWCIGRLPSSIRRAARKSQKYDFPSFLGPFASAVKFRSNFSHKMSEGSFSGPVSNAHPLTNAHWERRRSPPPSPPSLVAEHKFPPSNPPSPPLYNYTPLPSPLRTSPFFSCAGRRIKKSFFLFFFRAFFGFLWRQM